MKRTEITSTLSGVYEIGSVRILRNGRSGWFIITGLKTRYYPTLMAATAAARVLIGDDITPVERALLSLEVTK